MEEKKNEALGIDQGDEIKRCAASYLETAIRNLGTASGIMNSYALAVASFISTFGEDEDDEMTLREFMDNVEEALHVMREEQRKEEPSCASE